MSSSRDIHSLWRRALRLALPLCTSVLLFSSVGCRMSIDRDPPPRRVVVVSEPSPPIEEVYYYYPTTEVYFSPSRSVYYWHDGGTWRNGSSLPPAYVIDTRSAVTINLNTSQPYTMHTQTVARYPHDNGRHKGWDK